MAKSNIGYIITAEFKGGVRYPDWTKENWRCDSIAGFKDICKRDGYECRNKVGGYRLLFCQGFNFNDTHNS